MRPPRALLAVRVLLARVLLLAPCALLVVSGVVRAQDEDPFVCSEQYIELCEDKCTLDGAREKNPACLEHESCYPDTGVCYDPCVTYQVASQKDVDVFDATCANRIARDAAEALVASSHASPLRDPPTVTAGPSSVPFSMFRNGLAHTGRSEYAGPSMPNVTWTFHTGGRVYSSPTLAKDGTVYVGCTDGFVYGVQRSGVIKWRYPANGPVVSTAAIGNPIGSDTTLFLGGADGTLHAVRRTDDRRSSRLGSDGCFLVFFWFFFGFSVSALRGVPSRLRRRPPKSADVRARPFESIRSNPSQVSANYGTSKWSYVRPRLHLGGKWQLRARRPIVSSAALAPEGIVYIGADTALYAVNAATGSGGFSGTVKWAYETRGRILASPALDGLGRIYVGTMEGSMYCLNQTNGEQIWRFDAEGGLYSSPSLDGHGRLFVGSVDSYVYALESVTGGLIWKFRTSAAVYSSPAMSPGDADATVFVGSTDWKLYAIRVKDGLLAWNQTLRSPSSSSSSSSSPPPPPPPPPSGSGYGDGDGDGDAATTPYLDASLRRKNEAAALLESEGVCPPNLEQGTSEELSYRFGWNVVLPCGRDTGAVGVVASPVWSPNGLIYVGSSDATFYALLETTGAVAWTLETDGAIGSSAAIDTDGQLYFATDAGTIYQVDKPYVAPAG